jgi:hypothetical protein
LARAERLAASTAARAPASRAARQNFDQRTGRRLDLEDGDGGGGRGGGHHHHGRGGDWAGGDRHANGDAGAQPG